MIEAIGASAFVPRDQPPYHRPLFSEPEVVGTSAPVMIIVTVSEPDVDLQL
jgi:hypothetical protein